MAAVEQPGESEICVDTPGGDFGADGVGFVPAGNAVLVNLAGRFGSPGLSAGRCAGPHEEDLRELLPSARVPLRDLRPGRRTRADLGARRTVAVGPYDVEVHSTLAADLTGRRVSRQARRRPRHGRARGPTPLRLIRERVQGLAASFRVQRVAGALGVRYGGGAACSLRAACALDGTLAFTPPAEVAGGRLSLTAELPRGVRVTSVRAALRRLARGGRLWGFGRPWRAPGTLSAQVARTRAATCRDEHPVAAPSLEVRRSRGRLRVDLRMPFEGDALRTRCSGPATGDLAERGRAVASATGPFGVLARPRVRLTLAGPGAFDRAGFSGTSSGALTLDLVRTRLALRESTRVRVVRR